jgi:aspartyl-tRNA(Asn)/glutamyl-tRNA(Gln) amidotransferase subunit B
MKYEVVIGLEVHCQLNTASKIFASDANQFGSEPNTNISVITLAHPGVLPKLNKRAVESAIKLGLACGSTINQKNYFDRKNYFYPDLPKGYQVSQDKFPICLGGGVTVRLKDGKTYKNKFLPFHHVHMEEDAGKSIHELNQKYTLLDYNRAGTPLLEIVSDPCIGSPEEAAAYLTEIRKIVRYLDICDGNMEEGSMRADLNISLRPIGDSKLGTKVEIKNMNSIRNLQKAAEYEIKRQSEALDAGDTLIQETRSFDPDSGKTSSMRVKETMNDYRYFPEPDLAPIFISDKQLADIQSLMPKLPNQLFKEFVEDYGILEEHAIILTEDKNWSDYFVELCALCNNKKSASNWMVATIKGYLNESNTDIKDFVLRPNHISELITLVDQGKISNTIASQKLMPLLIANPNVTALELAMSNNMIQESNSDTLQILVDEVLKEQDSKVQEYKKGKKGLMGMFVGEIMKKSKGTADPKLVNELLNKVLNS